MNEEENVESLDAQASGKKRRTRRAITPATALTKCLDALEKLSAEDRARALLAIKAYFAEEVVDG